MDKNILISSYIELRKKCLIKKNENIDYKELREHFLFDLVIEDIDIDIKECDIRKFAKKEINKILKQENKNIE